MYERGRCNIKIKCSCFPDHSIWINNNTDRKNKIVECEMCGRIYPYADAVHLWYIEESKSFCNKTDTRLSTINIIWDSMKDAIENKRYSDICAILEKYWWDIFRDLYYMLSGDKNLPIRKWDLQEFFKDKKQITLFDMEDE